MGDGCHSIIICSTGPRSVVFALVPYGQLTGVMGGPEMLGGA